MGCEQSSPSSHKRSIQNGNRLSKKDSIFIEENKSKDPPARPISKMDAKSMVSSTTQATKNQPMTHGENDKEGLLKQLPDFSLDSKLEDYLNDSPRRLSGSILNKDEIDVCLGQLTKEQHIEIYMFAKESSKLVHNYSIRLHENLISAMKESSDLAMIMENLKCSSRDVENCLDDLKAFPVKDEESFYTELEQRLLLAREVRRVYSQYLTGAVDYEGFRKVELDLLWGYYGGIGEKNKSLDSKEHGKIKEMLSNRVSESNRVMKSTENLVVITVEKCEEIMEKKVDIKTPPTQEGSTQDVDVERVESKENKEGDATENEKEEVIGVCKEEGQIKEEMLGDLKGKEIYLSVKEDVKEEEKGNLSNEKGAF